MLPTTVLLIINPADNRLVDVMTSEGEIAPDGLHKGNLSRNALLYMLQLGYFEAASYRGDDSQLIAYRLL